ncbi:MAG: hypothetical protein ACE15B_15025 [Bryobacteraceae bacterium]
MKAQVLFALAACAIPVAGEPAPALPPEAIVEQYCAVARDREVSLKGASMEVQIEAKLPRLKKWGRLLALRHISTIGRITYDALRFEGDNSVKTHVIARYLAAEVQNDRGPKLAVTPENYKFKYRKMSEFAGRQAYVFEVTPRRKEVGLFKGEFWIDAETYLCIRESGRFVKNPSIFLKKVEFVREYGIQDGISVPVRMQSVAQTRLVGMAELTIDFSNFSLAEGTKRASLAGEAQ